MSDALLQVDDMHTYLGDSYVIQGVSLEVPAGKVLAVLGRNGAGKTTTLRSIMRMVHPRRGRVTFDGRDISRLATVEVARSRIAFVQETRAIFPVAVGRGKSCGRRPPGAGRQRLDHAARVRRVSDPGATAPQWRHATVRRRAADAGDRKGADIESAPLAARRAERGTGAADHPSDRRHHHQSQTVRR